MTPEEHLATVENLQEMRAVFMPKTWFNDLVTNGAHGDEEFTMSGDDLASFCWAFDQLIERFGA